MTEAIENNIEQAEIVVEKPYTFRPLQAEDAFLMIKIIKAIGIREFKAVFENDGVQEMVAQFAEKEQKDGETHDDSFTVKAGIAVALELADVVIGNLPKCENDIFQLLANTSNMSEKAIRKMGFADFFGMVIDFIKKEEFKDFIKVVSRSFK